MYETNVPYGVQWSRITETNGMQLDIQEIPVDPEIIIKGDHHIILPTAVTTKLIEVPIKYIKKEHATWKKAYGMKYTCH